MKKLFKNLMPMLLLVAGLGISPNLWAGNHTIYFSPALCNHADWTAPYVNYGKASDDNWHNEAMDATSETFHGFPVFKKVITDKYSGFDGIQFHKSSSDWTDQINGVDGWHTTTDMPVNNKICTGKNTWVDYVADSEQTFYFCPKVAGKDWTTPYANCNLGYNHWSNVQMTEVSGKTFCGQKVYQATVTTCAFDKIEFHSSSSDYSGKIELSNPSGVNGKLYNGSEWKTFSYDTEYTFYFATDWSAVYANCNLGYNIWKDLAMTNTGKTYNGKKIYSITVAAQGFNDIEFHKSQGGDWDSKVVGYSNSTTYKKDFTNALCTAANNWVAYNYDVTLTFDPKNGGATTNKVTLKGGSITAPSAPSRTGYTFQGWGTSKVAAGGTISNVQADATYDAQWTANTNTPYTVKHYKQNLDGTYPSTATETENLTGTTDASVTPAVKNYTGFTAPSTQTKTIAADGSLVVEYYYTRNSHTLTWNANGGTIDGKATKEETLKYGATITVPQESSLSYSGYNFTGWNTTPASTMPDDDVTYTAQWEVAATATVTYDGNGNTGGTVPEDATTYAPGATVTVLTGTPEKTGYNFTGWKNSDGGAILSAGNTFTINSSVTLTAQWEIVNYSITYTGLEGASHTNPATYTVETETFSFTAPSAREGYTFTGWSPASITKGTTGDITVTASWTLNHHTLTWNLDGGSITTPGTPAGEVDYGTTLVAPVVEKTGYTFAGWTPSVAATMPDNNVTYTATWTENLTAVTVSSNNITWGTVSPTSANVGVATTTTLTATHNTGYKFVNWTLSGGATSTSTLTNATITIKGNGVANSTGTATANFEEDLTTGWRINLGYEGLEQWFTDDFVKKSGESTQSVGYVELNLPENYDYKFKVVKKGNSDTWYGNNNNDEAPKYWIKGDVSDWTFYSDAGDCYMKTTEAGIYTFKIDFSGNNPKVSVTYPAAETFAVTISAGDNGSVEPNGEQQVDAFNGISVTAKPNPGYRFKQWVTSDGVSVTNSTSATTTVKATKAGTLQATFTTEGMIYFNKAGIKDKWQGDVYVYFYKGEYWDKNGKGSGSKTTDDGNCTSGPRKMNRLGNSDIYYYDYAGAGISRQSGVICFTDKYLSEAANFHQCSASYRTDFHTCANMFVPRDYIDYYNECAYYSKGYWRTFQSTDPGYDIHIWNNHNGSGDPKAHGNFTSTSNLSNDFTFTANLDANHTYGFKISACGGTWYGNQGTMIQDCNWEFDSEGTYTNNCGLTTTAAGEYKFTLNCTDGWLRVSVEYPLSEGDYRLAYEELSGSNITKIHPTHHIKALRADGTKTDTVSFFVQQKTDAYIYLQKCTAISGTNITWTNDGKKVDLSTFANGAGVYNFTLTQTKSGATLTPEVALLEAYAGPYYIRTDCAGGGWSAYDIADNKMTQTDILAQNTDGFDHYFVKWVAAKTNVKYCVANDYSEALTDSLPGDTYIGNEKQVLPQDANVRFMWNSKTNALERAYLSGSTNTEDRYLVLEGDARMFFADGKEIGEGTDADHRKGLREHELPFEDKNNWVYQADIKAKPNCAVKLTAAYNNNVQYFIGKADGDEASSRKTIIAGSGDDKYKMRVVYDFKTNLLIAGWIPSDTIKSVISLGGDMLITRTHQDSAQQIIFGTDEAKITDIHHVYGVLTLKKDTMTDAATMSTDASTGKYYENNLYWISFPFEVKISEIFGVDGYGTKWIIQRYRGDLRAQKGWFAETPTFWEYMSQEETLKAYEGYVLCLDPNYFYPTDAEVWNNNATEANFYFPSASGEIGIVHAANYDQTVLPHECKINREFNVEGIAGTQNHTMTDSHWNVIGVPAFQNANGSVVPEEGNTKFKSFYEWNPKTNGYTPQVVDKNYAFKTMHAYMVQFYGTINWTNVSIISNEIAAAPYRYADNKNYMIELFFNGNGAEDHTYIKLADEASTDFVLNEDMMKLDNAGYPNIYSFAGNYNVAYNETKMDNQTVILGVSAPKAGTYTFSMPNQFSGTAKLIDLVEGITTDLNISNYSVDLSKGTYNNRFQLLLEVEAKAPTSIENVDGSLWNEDGKTTKILHNGNIYLINAGRVYNVLGVEE